MFTAEASITWSARDPSTGRRSHNDIKVAMKIEFAKEFQFFFPKLNNELKNKISILFFVENYKMNS